MPVRGVGVAVKVSAFVDKPLAPRIDDDAEGIVVLLKAVANGQVAIGRRIHVPLHSMRTGPVAIDSGTDFDGHAMAPPVVEARTPYLREVPIGTQITSTHFGIGLKPAASEHHRLGPQFQVLTASASTHALHTAAGMNEAKRGGVVEHWDARPVDRSM